MEIFIFAAGLLSGALVVAIPVIYSYTRQQQTPPTQAYYKAAQATTTTQAPSKSVIYLDELHEDKIKDRKEEVE